MGVIRRVAVFLAIVLGHGVTTKGALAADHTDQQMRQVGRITELVTAGKEEAAVAIAEQARASAATLDRNDPRRADALELQRAVLKLRGDYKAALPLSTEVIRIRRAAEPVEFVLLGFALLDHAVITYGSNQYAEADKALREAVDAFRQGFARTDFHLADRLESAAAFAGDFFNRPRMAMDLYKEAISIREGARGNPPGSLAHALQSLAMLEARQGSTDEADAHFERAADILSGLINSEGSKVRLDAFRGGLAQILIMRAGMATRTQRLADASALIDQAQAVNPDGGDNALELQFYAAKIRANVFERQGDIDNAVAQTLRQLELAARLPGDQHLLAADIYGHLGGLLRARGDLDEATTALETALKLKGGEGPETASIMLQMADIESRRGDAAAAEARYQRGLQYRKGAISEVPVLFGTNRTLVAGSVAKFGGDLASALTLGEAIVLVPGGPGSPDAVLKPSGRLPIPVGPATAADRLIPFKPTVLSAQEFEEIARRKVARARFYPRAALVFVHGFGTKFDFALARVGQITRDLNFDGPAFVFTWPSQGNSVSLTSYNLDQDRARNSVDSLVAFFETVAATSKAEKIHIIAHSMGNRVLLPALSKIKSRASLSAKIGEVVFAAPDVDQAEFADQIKALGPMNLTLYASANDRALWASWFVNMFSVRAGYVARGLLSSSLPVIVPGVDSIDVSEAGEDLLSSNHDVYASNPVVTEDLRKLLQTGQRPPDTRSSVVLEKRSTKEGASYWYYRRPRKS
jgi:esterase/lipase superfamily enzyme